MTNPELKVSDKVRELAENIALTSDHADLISRQIQSALSELLEAAKLCANEKQEDRSLRRFQLRAILSKWEPK